MNKIYNPTLLILVCQLIEKGVTAVYGVQLGPTGDLVLFSIFCFPEKNQLLEKDFFLSLNLKNVTVLKKHVMYGYGFESPLRRLFFSKNFIWIKTLITLFETLYWHCCMCFNPANGSVDFKERFANKIQLNGL